MQNQEIAEKITSDETAKFFTAPLIIIFITIFVDLFGAAFGLGFIFGPALAGVLSKYGIGVPFYFAAALSLANAIALYFILPESLKPGLRDQGSPRKGKIAEIFETLADPRFRVLAL